MKRMLTALSIAALGTLYAGSSFAYQTSLGEDANGSSTSIRPFPLSLAAQLDFLGSGTPRVENFEDRTLLGRTGPLTLAFGSGNTAVNATLSGANGIVQRVTTPTDGRYSVPGGDQFWAATATSSGDTFSIAFSENVEAFGFFGIDIGDFGGNLSMELLNAAGNMMGTGFRVNTLTSGQDGSVLYFGIRADNPGEWFRGIRFRLTNTTTQLDAFAFDSFTVVAAPRTTPPGQIPEPGTLALIGLALLASSLVRRRA